jgi:hypothetical protein
VTWNQQGPKGDQGIQGVKGDKGDQGIQGEKGDQGVQGVKGDQGIQGVKGDKGDQGIQGVKGDKGDQGIQGVKGDKGDQGIQGPPGASGISGYQLVRVEKGLNIAQGFDLHVDCPSGKVALSGGYWGTLTTYVDRSYPYTGFSGQADGAGWNFSGGGGTLGGTIEVWAVCANA